MKDKAKSENKEFTTEFAEDAEISLKIFKKTEAERKINQNKNTKNKKLATEDTEGTEINLKIS